MADVALASVWGIVPNAPTCFHGRTSRYGHPPNCNTQEHCSNTFIVATHLDISLNLTFFLCLCSTTSIHVLISSQIAKCIVVYGTTDISNDVVQCTSPNKRDIGWKVERELLPPPMDSKIHPLWSRRTLVFPPGPMNYHQMGAGVWHL